MSEKNEVEVSNESKEALSKAMGFEVTETVEDMQKGFEQITPDKMSVPFIKLLQKTSPQCDKDDDAYVEGAEPGYFINSVTNEVYEPGLKIFILAFEHVYLEWIPRDLGGGLVATHDTMNAQRLAVNPTDFKGWKTEDGHELDENYMYYILIEGRESEGIAILSMKSTSIKAAKKMNRELTNTIMDNGVKAPGHFIRWDLGSVYCKKDTNSWYQFTTNMVENNRFIKTQNEYDLISNNRKALPAINTISMVQLEDTSNRGTDSIEDDV